MRLFFTLLLSLILLAPAYAGNAAPKVVTSLHPLKLIIDEIMAGVAVSESLIPMNSSPHHFQFKPSHIRKTMNADMLVWIHSDFETGLKRLQQILPGNIARLPLLEDSDEGNVTDKNAHIEHHEMDGHIWLSADKVIMIANRITQQLKDLDPDHAVIYQRNLEQLTSNLNNWRQTSQQHLTRFNSAPSYILDHDFLSHFEQSLGLKHLGTLHNNQDHGSSLRSLSNLHKTLKQSAQTNEAVKCLLVPQLPVSAQVTQLQKQYLLKLIPVYILGQPEHKNIIQLLDSIFTALQNCQ